MPFPGYDSILQFRFLASPTTTPTATPSGKMQVSYACYKELFLIVWYPMSLYHWSLNKDG